MEEPRPYGAQREWPRCEKILSQSRKYISTVDWRASFPGPPHSMLLRINRLIMKLDAPHGSSLAASCLGSMCAELVRGGVRLGPNWRRAEEGAWLRIYLGIDKRERFE